MKDNYNIYKNWQIYQNLQFETKSFKIINVN